MGDLSFKPIGEVRIGDEVVGFRSLNGKQGFSNASRNNLCRAIVIDVRSKIDKIVKITLSSGRVIRCTADHKWLVRRDTSNTWKYGQAVVGTYMAIVIVPSPERPVGTDHDASWLAGMYDGEGSDRHIAQCPGANPKTYAQIAVVGERLGIKLSPDKKGYVITGGRQGYVDFLNIVKPVKCDRLERLVLGRTLIQPPDKIVSIESDGEEEVFCLTTTTGNYIAWGYASKNSANHSETVDQLMRWPWRRFEEFFDRHLRRQARASVERQRDALIASINANPNYDGSEAAKHKEERLRAIEEASQQAMETIGTRPSHRPSDPDPFDEDPLFRPLRKAAQVPELVMAEAGLGREMLDGMA